jgi:hypothetical protein
MLEWRDTTYVHPAIRGQLALAVAPSLLSARSWRAYLVDVSMIAAVVVAVSSPVIWVSDDSLTKAADPQNR